MRAAFAAPVVASVLVLGGAPARALSLGQVGTSSRLGQPLDFSVAVQLDADDHIAPSCAKAQVRAGDNTLPATKVRVRWVRASPDAREAVAHVSTTVRMNEPVVTITLSLGCPTRLTHQFVTLLDPPSGLPTARATVATGGAASPRDAGAGHASTSRPAAPASPRASAQTSVATAAAPVPASGDASHDNAAAASTPYATASDLDRQKMLEDRLEQQQRAMQATQAALAGMQQRLREAEQSRRSDAAVYGLAALVTMLLGIVGLLWWRLARLQNQRDWTREARALAAQSGVQAVDSGVPSSSSMPLYDEATLTSMRVVQPSVPPKEAETSPGVSESAPAPMPTSPRARRGLTAEELVDLEQQADFFIVLGQEEAAIDLLMSHVRSSGGTSPMPYLKLLDIYRRRGEADAYDRIRERFNRRFNGHAPPWEVDLQSVRALEDYPQTLAQLQALWSVPARAVELLEALLFRRDSSPDTFELRAYEELLFLYAVARDVFEREVSPDGVDLLLPLGTDEPPAIVHADTTQRLDANVRTRPSGVDVELDF
jgi:hypothetical protein